MLGFTHAIEQGSDDGKTFVNVASVDIAGATGTPFVNIVSVPAFHVIPKCAHAPLLNVFSGVMYVLELPPLGVSPSLVMVAFRVPVDADP